MKICLLILAFTLSLNGFTQTLCGTADENSSVTLTAPAGQVFVSVTFASYGTPNGSCGSFTIGTCHAANSKTIVETALLNKNSATIAATNTVFGDPCNGTFKRLYIEAVYSFPLPLSLISFSSISNGHSNILKWQTSNEVNTKTFEVERSSDGLHFSAIGTVTAANNSGTNLYSYADNSLSQQIYFYRLKMIDLDGGFAYSNLLKTETASTGKLNVFPTPATDYVSFSGPNATGYAELLTLQGVIVKRIFITGNTQIIDLANCAAGMYILKYATGQNTLYQKIVKQ